jgi:hypothetical protein
MHGLGQMERSFQARTKKRWFARQLTVEASVQAREKEDATTDKPVKEVERFRRPADESRDDL